jgi:hypothetical protein
MRIAGSAGGAVTPSIYLAVDAVWVRCGWHDFACAVTAIVLIDFIINAAFDAMQTHMDSRWLSAARGWDSAMTTKTSRKVAKIAKRRKGRPPDGGFGRVAIKSLETILVLSRTCRAKLPRRQTFQNQRMSTAFGDTICPFWVRPVRSRTLLSLLRG